MLFVMVGPSGAGKTTFINSELMHPDALDLKAVVVSSDAIRMELNGNIEDQSNNTKVFELFYDRIAKNLAAGRNVVADATHLKRKDRLRTAMVGLNLGLDVVYVVINRPLAEKIATAGWREGIVLPNGKSLIEAHDETFHTNLSDILAGDSLRGITVVDRRKT